MGAQHKIIFKSLFTHRENWVFIPVIVIILILLLYSLFSVYVSTPSRPQLSIYSNDWNDLSKCRETIQDHGYKISSIISTPTILSKFSKEEYRNMVYMAVGVELAYSADEAYAIWEFVREGGNIIIADDFGHGNSLLNNAPHIGDEIKFGNQQLFDQNYIKNTKFVTINATFDNMWYNLILNEPSALKIQTYYDTTSNIYTMGRSSEGSWLDENQNGVRDPNELKTSYGVIVSLLDREYKGNVIIISDPGLFINDNWPLMDNSRFVLALLSYFLPDGGEVIFDESRHINEDTFENSRHILYSGIIYLTSTTWSIFLISFLIIVFTIIIGVKIKPQRIWRNRNLLDRKYLNILNYPYEGPYDYWQIYRIFLEKVRLGYGFSPEEFGELDNTTLKNLINDPYLWDFITQEFPMYQGIKYYNFIKRRLLDWLPQYPGQDYFTIKKFLRDMDHDRYWR